MKVLISIDGVLSSLDRFRAFAKSFDMSSVVVIRGSQRVAKGILISLFPMSQLLTSKRGRAALDIICCGVNKG